MSKKWNRNIQRKFEQTKQVHEYQDMTADSGGCDVSLSCFGEPTSYKTSDCGHFKRSLWERLPNFPGCTSDDVLENIISDNASMDKSSSSSLSWGEECEIEATQLVKKEYDRMVRVLQGLEPIPPNYDKDEYTLWIKTFPSLSSAGPTTKPGRPRRTRFKEPSSPPYVEINNYANQKNNLKTGTTSTLIDDLLDKLSAKIYVNSNSEIKRNATKKKPKRKHLNDVIPTGNTNSDQKLLNKYPKVETLEKKFESFLRISPAPTVPPKVSTAETQKRTPRSLRTTNWINSNFSEYDSLPYLPVSENVGSFSKPTNTSAKKSSNNRRKRGNISKSNQAYKVLPMNTTLVLPPINSVHSQFRSISAMPLTQNKSCSAASTKTCLNFDSSKRPEIIELSNNVALKRNYVSKNSKKRII